MRRIALASGIISLIFSVAIPMTTSASSMPSGQVMIGNTTFSFATNSFVGGGGTIEPAWNDGNGTLTYLYTPTNATVHPTSHNVAPLYLTVYPVGSTVDPTILNCQHMPSDNCPDHGPIVAGAAAAMMPSVYSGGVLGHDHLVGIAPTGGDFNVVWEPVFVLFTPQAVSDGAINTHITTLAQLNAAVTAGDVAEIPLPFLDFNCTVVSAALYASGTPAPSV
jgi:hypothetical protein